MRDLKTAQQLYIYVYSETGTLLFSLCVSVCRLCLSLLCRLIGYLFGSLLIFNVCVVIVMNVYCIRQTEVCVFVLFAFRVLTVLSYQ